MTKVQVRRAPSSERVMSMPREKLIAEFRAYQAPGEDLYYQMWDSSGDWRPHWERYSALRREMTRRALPVYPLLPWQKVL